MSAQASLISAKIDLKKAWQEREDQFIQQIKNINSNLGISNCNLCAFALDDYLSDGVGCESLGPVSTNTSDLHLEYSDKHPKRFQIVDLRLQFRIPISKKYGPDATIQISDSLEIVCQDKKNKKTIRFITSNFENIREDLKGLPRRVGLKNQNNAKTAHGFICLVYDESTKGVGGQAHIFNFFVDEYDQVYFLDAQDHQNPNRWVLSLPPKAFFKNEVYFINSQPPEGFYVKKEPLSEKIELSSEFLLMNMRKRALKEVRDLKIEDNKECVAAFLGDIEHLKYYTNRNKTIALEKVKKKNIDISYSAEDPVLFPCSLLLDLPIPPETALTPLMAAVLGRQIESVKYILNSIDDTGKLKSEIVKKIKGNIFIKRFPNMMSGVNLDIIDIAVISGYIPMLYLLELYFNKINFKLNSDAFFSAIASANIGMFQYLINKDLTIIYKVHSFNHITPLEFAIERGLNAKAKYIIDADIDNIFLQSKLCTKLLMVCVKVGNLEIFQILLQKRPDLLFANLDFNLTKTKKNPDDKKALKIKMKTNFLIVAIYYSQYNMMHFLLEADKGRRLLLQTDNVGRNPLMYAAKLGRIPALKILLKCDFENHLLRGKTIKNGYNCLHLAIKDVKDPWPIVSILLEQDKEHFLVQDQCILGHSLHVSAYSKNIETFFKLLENYPKLVNTPSDDGFSILMRAVSVKENAEVIKGLLKNYPEQFFYHCRTLNGLKNVRDILFEHYCPFNYKQLFDFSFKWAQKHPIQLTQEEIQNAIIGENKSLQEQNSLQTKIIIEKDSQIFQLKRRIETISKSTSPFTSQSSKKEFEQHSQRSPLSLESDNVATKNGLLPMSVPYSFMDVANCIQTQYSLDTSATSAEKSTQAIGLSKEDNKNTKSLEFSFGIVKNLKRRRVETNLVDEIDMQSQPKKSKSELTEANLSDCVNRKKESEDFPLDKIKPRKLKYQI